MPKLNYFHNENCTGEQDHTTENVQESAKAIVVTDWMNKYNYQYLLDENRWIKLNKFPKSVSYICGILEINDDFYVIGSKGISTLNNEVYKFPSNKQYGCCATCRLGNNIFLVCKKNYYDDVESRLFNPITNQWSDVNIETERYYFPVVYYLSKVYIVGGNDSRQKLNSIEVYDPVSKTQDLVPIKMNEARSSHKVIVYNNKLFVFGGFGKDGPLNSVEMFSPETKKFVMMAPMKFARSDFGCCRVRNLVYVIGGATGFADTKSVEIYNMDSNTWTDGVDFPVAEYNLYACAVNNKLE